jgi:hypothetical protein
MIEWDANELDLIVGEHAAEIIDEAGTETEDENDGDDGEVVIWVTDLSIGY